MDWSTRRVVDLMEMILMSAGTLSPTSAHTDRKGVVLFMQDYNADRPQPECSATAGRLREQI